MSGTVQAWFVVEMSSQTHDFVNNGRSLSIFNSTNKYERFPLTRTLHA
ncbi:hypothetical protein JNUCC42_06065 [Brevibacterium sp. JNUCC-42]|nr:hypothetical protein [Brevibacillus laterosporus]QOT00287.1 hypothetical protein JNUCC42_06065 [Brevibacterium sp. JNUCC-42]